MLFHLYTEEIVHLAKVGHLKCLHHVFFKYFIISILFPILIRSSTYTKTMRWYWPYALIYSVGSLLLHLNPWSIKYWSILLYHARGTCITLSKAFLVLVFCLHCLYWWSLVVVQDKSLLGALHLESMIWHLVDRCSILFILQGLLELLLYLIVWLEKMSHYSQFLLLWVAFATNLALCFCIVPSVLSFVLYTHFTPMMSFP